jgi:hypothetical protein
MGRQESGVRSQNGRAVPFQQPAYFFELSHELMAFAVPEIVRQNQVVTTFLKRALGYVNEAGLVAFTSLPKTFGNVGRNRD